ncbi:NAD(P)H-dependent oxidoreductase subunit E [Clostridium cochlearium]|uniref:NADH-quinone oxidoreductase subunit NuoE family protein n=1 Tax=Clostridium cochlearium TaxID=1494 RepID=UPI001EDED4FD|nr:NAD(P)H-dependent oxidoreductase subunit E [Bacteroidales bacterium MSK.15.36]MCG4571424.1 NAD(P)H-dependent oxidoreductase subunit E [Clostridium cochlearium]MCG4579791.1 NAD(P)H-dependent oxidoreductase subunit E [Clostridium cochlearium]
MEELQGFTKEQVTKLDEIIEKHKEDSGKLIPMLEEVQALLGYVPVSVQERIASKTGISENRIYGVVSFYSFFTMKPRARHRVQICLGTACYVKGGKEIAEKIEKEFNVKPGESTKDGRFTYETTRCFGTCGLAPVIAVDGKVYGKVKPEEVMDILNEYK